MLYINKNYNHPDGEQETKEVSEIFFHDSNNVQRKIVNVYQGRKLIWELIVGYLQTRNGDMLQCNGGFIVKCKNQ